MARWADYSGGRPSGAALKAAGFSGAIRYIGLGSEGKQLSAAEYRDLVATFGAANVLLVAEAGTADAWGTDTDDDYARGLANGRAALADARATGVPDSVGIACAADAHAANFQIDDVVRYATGFRDAVGQQRCGFYGFAETLTAVHDAGIGSWYWRCGSEPTAAEKAWVNFWQRNKAPTVVTVSGIQCDLNEVYRIPNQEVPDMDNTQAAQLDYVFRVLQRYPADAPNGQMTSGKWTGDAAEVGRANYVLLSTLSAKVDALTATVAAALKDPSLDEAKVTQIINDAVASNLHITGTVEITGAAQ